MSDQRSDTRRTFASVSIALVLSALVLSALALSIMAIAWWSVDRDDDPARPLVPSLERAAGVEIPVTADGSVCRLLAFAGVADPSLQRAAARSPDEIDAVADVQREALVEAARLLGPGPDADVLSTLASVFVDPGRWSDRQWAEALVDRASPDRVATLERLETDCAARDEIEN